MKTVKFNYQGIARGASQQDIADGWCDEIINLRYRNGKLQARGLPTRSKYLPVELDHTQPEAGMLPLRWTKIWKHEQDNITNYVGFSNNAYWSEQSLRLIDFDGGTTTEIKVYTSVIDVQFLKRYMIVIHAGGMDRFVWKDGAYVEINIDSRPDFSVETDSVKYATCEDSGSLPFDDVGEAIIGKYFARLNEISKDGYITGTLMVRAALKMFDGNYVLHTLPVSVHVHNHSLTLVYSKTSASANGHIQFSYAKPSVYLSNLAYFANYASLKDVIQSVVIFASKMEHPIKVDSDLAEKIQDLIENNVAGTYYLNDSNTGYTPVVNPDYKDLHDTASWYKVAEIPLSKILEGDVTQELDVKDFYQDYATRETLPVDNFTHLEVMGNISYNYNSRLILGDTETKFGDYRYFPAKRTALVMNDSQLAPSGYSYIGTQDFRMVVTLDTDNGEIKKLTQAYTRPIFQNASIEPYFSFSPVGVGLIGYPDARATRIEFLIQVDSKWYFTIQSFALTKSKYDNFSYYIDQDFDTKKDSHTAGTGNFPVIMMNTDANPTDLEHDDHPEQTLYDKNRVQISELNNPFFFPAENSYQVGTGQILQIATNTEPLSSGQFGEYPIIVMTRTGIWTMLQGQGDVLFSSVKPLNGDVIDNKNNVIAVPGGVTYTTPRGLFLQSGGKSISLSENLEGSPNFDLYETANFALRLNHLQLIQMPDAVSEVDFIDYLPDSKIGYDRILNELLVTNESYNYSYVYSFDAGKWTKISQSFQSLVNSYPKLLCVSYTTGNTGLFDFSAENFDSQVSGVIVSRPCKIDGQNNFILLHRALQRCEIETAANVYAGFYVFGSNDLTAWQLVAGNDRKSGRITDILTTRAHLKLKYFVFVFASTIKEKSAVNSVEIQYYSKLTNKIR